MVEADEHSTHLGLPNIIGRNKSAILGFLKEKVNTRIKNWDNKFISRSGKELLVKSVAQALPVYAMNVFIFPLEITQEIERALSKFWWSTTQNNGTTKSQLCWMSWDRMARHKNAGGLGFKNFRDYNMAMLGKQGWRFGISPNSLTSRIYKARYFANTDFIHSNLGHNPSFIWRSIIEAKQVLLAGVRWRIGTGVNIKIMGQPWLRDDDNPYITSVSPAIKNATVDALFKKESK